MKTVVHTPPKEANELSRVCNFAYTGAVFLVRDLEGVVGEEVGMVVCSGFGDQDKSWFCFFEDGHIIRGHELDDYEVVCRLKEKTPPEFEPW